MAPLIDDEFNRSKSPIKAMDYAALGVAVVASDVPAYRGMVRHNQTGLLVPNEPEAWRQALRDVILAPRRRHELAERARGFVRRAFGRHDSTRVARRALRGGRSSGRISKAGRYCWHTACPSSWSAGASIIGRVDEPPHPSTLTACRLRAGVGRLGDLLQIHSRAIGKKLGATRSGGEYRKFATALTHRRSECLLGDGRDLRIVETRRIVEAHGCVRIRSLR